MTEIDDDCAALVADPNEMGLSIYWPKDVEDTTGMFTFLCACATRASEDPDWAQAMIDWFIQHERLN